MSLFDLTPQLPGVDEQRDRIDRTLQQEARTGRSRAEVKAASSVVENDIDDVLLNISAENKARLYEQFADSPRSRAAVNLVKEIYGGTLPFPLPQAVKRIEELVELGRLDGIGDPYNLFDKVRDELDRRGYAVSGELVEDGINEFRSQVGYGDFTDVSNFIESEFLSEEPDAELNEQPLSNPTAKADILQEVERIKTEYNGALVMWQVGDFYEMYGVDARNAAGALGVSMTQRSDDVPTSYTVTGIPGNSLDDCRQKLTGAGYSVAVSSAGGDGERKLVLYTVSRPPYEIGDKLMYNGKLHEIMKISDFIQLQNRDLDNPASYPIFDNISLRRDDFENRLITGELKIEPPEAAAPKINDPEADKPLYNVGDTVYLEGGKAYQIRSISENTGEVELHDPTKGYYVIRPESKSRF
ncbi:MAG: hypothetical protein LBS90_06355, partial [Oscillospiraceae bacterium]|nr:hypothetical protein [Oscillospiraceae bacterium]